ncbi:MAG: hypothetical protein ACOX79_11215 [Methanosarcina sp.]
MDFLPGFKTQRFKRSSYEAVASRRGIGCVLREKRNFEIVVCHVVL